MATDNRNRTDVAAHQPPAPAAAGRGFWAWLGRKLVHPMFLFVALLIAALMVRPIIYGEPATPLVFWLVAILVLLGLLDLLTAGGGGLPGWLGRRLVHPIFLFVALLLAALMVRPLIYGEGVSGAALWLVGVLILLAFLDLADVSRFQKPQTAPKLDDIPLGLVTGSVRALTGLILLVAFFFFLLAAPKIIPENKEFLEKAVMLIGGWLGVVIGFYFGSRAAEKHEGPAKDTTTTATTTTTPGASTPATTTPATPTASGGATPSTPPAGPSGISGTTGGEGR